MTGFQLVTQIPRQDSQPSAASLASQIPSKAPTPSLVTLATPHANVSAFCRAVLSKLVPRGFWGDGDQGQGNERIVMDSVDRFVRLRRFESFSLHLVFQRLKVRYLLSHWTFKNAYAAAAQGHVMAGAPKFRWICQDCYVRHAETQRHLSRIPLLCL